MKVYSISENHQNQTFGFNLPKKKSYKAMQVYYDLICDRGTAIEYKILHNQAKSRLHNIKSQKAENEFLDLADEYPEYETIGTRLKHIYKTVKMVNKAIYEKLASIYYGWL